MAGFGNYSLGLIFVASLIAILGATELGRWFGTRVAGQGGDDVSTLESATLGLLALMIGFTFSMALSRFDARRDGVLQEANAIGTTALRARLLPAPHNTEVLKLLREYTQLRLDFAQRLASPERQVAMLDRSNAIQEGLWQQAKEVAAKDNAMVPTGIFIQTLNDMIDCQATRLAALRNRVPDIVLLALYGTAVVGAGFAGYAAGLAKDRSRVGVYVMGVLVAVVILLIQDLDRPSHGFVMVSQQPMIDTANSLAGF